MILIGEKLNSSIPKTFEAMKEKNAARILKLIRDQADAGAEYLDINCALCKDEYGMIKQIAKAVTEHTSCKLMIDSPDGKILARAAEEFASRDIILNSVTLTERFEDAVPIAVETGCGIVAMPMADEIPETAEERLKNAKEIVARLESAGISRDKIYIDVMITSVGAEYTGAKTTLDSIRLIRKAFQDIKITGGVSNISFGLPNRRDINSYFLTCAVINGLDCPIIDVMRPEMKKAIALGVLLSGKDEFCMEYIEYATENM